jgi:hypothetical protein
MHDTRAGVGVGVVAGGGRETSPLHVTQLLGCGPNCRVIVKVVLQTSSLLTDRLSRKCACSETLHAWSRDLS